MFEIKELTLKKIQAAFDAGEITSWELTAMYMERIADIDKSGPGLNSVIEINPDALYIAEAMDRERKLKGSRGILHGVPVLIKDNINTKDMMHTSAGSIALADNYAPYDATVAKKLREAGAVILGKTNMTELANYMSYTMKNGYSSRGGQVINPYNPEGNTWGSSSGSAVATSANLCAVSIGTETDGSIIWPSHNNGIVGIKPTRGLVSRHGIVPICTAQDTAGPMCRTVEDCAALLNIIVGYDEEDPSTWSREGQIAEDYTAFLDKDGLKGLRIGINRGYYAELTEEQKELAEKGFQTLRDCGAELVEGVDLPHQRCDSSVLLYEFQQCLNAYLSTCSPALKVRTLKDIIDYNNDRPKEGLKYGQSILIDAQYNTSGTLTDPKYIRDRLAALKQTRENGIDKVLDENNCDLYVAPGISDASPISGYPSIVVPLGLTPADNMPFGLSFVGRAFSEPTLIKAAYAFEQAFGGRAVPEW